MSIQNGSKQCSFICVNREHLSKQPISLQNAFLQKIAQYFFLQHGFYLFRMNGVTSIAIGRVMCKLINAYESFFHAEKKTAIYFFVH